MPTARGCKQYMIREQRGDTVAIEYRNRLLKPAASKTLLSCGEKKGKAGFASKGC